MYFNYCRYEFNLTKNPGGFVLLALKSQTHSMTQVVTPEFVMTANFQEDTRHTRYFVNRLRTH